MRRYRPFLIVALISVIFVGPGQIRAQAPEGSQVVFVADPQLQAPSLTDPRRYGLTRLEAMFRELGARTGQITLDQPIPDDARVVVLVRPVGQLPISYTSRLWAHLSKGNHLLLAVDPNGQFGARTEPARGALSVLLAADYGISLQDTVAIEPGFSIDSIANLNTSFSLAYAVDHAVSAPLVQYDLPVLVWGARSLVVEPLTLVSHATPLLLTPTAYSETLEQVFRASDDQPAQLEMNPGDDYAGPLFIGALAENLETGSRIVALGDSELLQDGLGLQVDQDRGMPLYPGNHALAQRLAAWLLGLPPQEWNALPAGFTWLAMDGQSDDWDDQSAVWRADPDPNNAVRELRAFRDDSFLYITVRLAIRPGPDIALKLEVDTDGDGSANLEFAADREAVSVTQADQAPVKVADIRLAMGSALEMRVPLRIVGENAIINAICVTDGESPAGCVEPFLSIQTIGDDRAPVDVGTSGGRLATVSPALANVRAGPGTHFELVNTLAHGRVLSVIGRNATGDWIQTQNARHTGWMASYLLEINGDIEGLPVVGEP